jgi:hypothetical protein
MRSRRASGAVSGAASVNEVERVRAEVEAQAATIQTLNDRCAAAQEQLTQARWESGPLTAAVDHLDREASVHKAAIDRAGSASQSNA